MTTPKSAKRTTWEAFSKFIRNRDPGCVTCGNPTTCAGHFFHTSDKSTNPHLGGNEVWYSEKNVNGQCNSCNIHKSGNLAPYSVYLEEKYGFGIIQKLRDLFNTPKKWSIEEVLEVKEKYKNLVKQGHHSI